MPRTTVPSLVSITEVTQSGATDPKFVITNEATGRYFSADLTTVRFVEALRRTGDIGTAARDAAILPQHADVLVDQMRGHGLIADGTAADATPAATGPIEGRLVSVKFDLMDAAWLARRLHWIGRLAFSLPGFVIWLVVAVAALSAFLSNTDKVLISLRQMTSFGLGEWAIFILLYVGLKLIHELGHVLAYRVYCTRSDLNPGPIRVGIMIFAAMPFPFTDVTGAWRLRSRFQRAAIGAGGMYFEVFTVALLTLFWAATSAGPIHAQILQVAVFSGAMTLIFNINPAVKLDGYYILTDLLRQPNIAGRASRAARNWAARRLGGNASGFKSYELGYWLLAYAYRWTIFVGIFWVAYRFDPRLAPIAAAVTIMLLVIRPLIATIRHARKQGARPVRVIGTVAVAASIAALMFVPFQARLLIDGQLLTYRSTFIRPPEPALVRVGQSDSNPLVLEAPELAQQRTDLALQRDILVSLNRAISSGAAESAALASDLENLDRLITQTEARATLLAVSVPANAAWTPLAAEVMADAWALPGDESPLGAVSQPVAAYLRLTVPQSKLTSAVADEKSRPVAVRLVSQPRCEFAATLRQTLSASVVVDGQVIAEAEPADPLPDCAQDLRNGAAVVARVSLPPQSVVERTRNLMSRLLQNRLPIETNETL